MPKLLTIQLEVPSGSRPDKMLDWLNKQLNPHRMQVLTCIETPPVEPGQVLVLWPGPRGELAIWKDLKLLDLKSGRVQATVVQENNSGRPAIPVDHTGMRDSHT